MGSSVHNRTSGHNWGIWVDTEAIVSGNLGSHKYPVNNFLDAVKIARLYEIHCIRLKDSIITREKVVSLIWALKRLGIEYDEMLEDAKLFTRISSKSTNVVRESHAEIYCWMKAILENTDFNIEMAALELMEL